MDFLKISEIARAVNGEVLFSEGGYINGISIDSRTIAPGNLFIAIEGERFDGHDYVEEAFLRGAAAALVHRPVKGNFEGKSIIKALNTKTALGNLAAWYRRRFDIPVVAVTGSVGKTSTKEMIASVLAQKYSVLKNEGNFNNEIGLPLTIFKLKKEHDIAVLEMGMSGFGEIERLSEIANPDVAVITNIGFSHIGNLGSRRNILRAKMEIIKGLKPKGVLILNGDDELLSGTRGLIEHKTVFYGIDEGVDVQAFNIQSLKEKGISFSIALGAKEYNFLVPVPGLHNVYNALAAICTGITLGMDMNDIKKGISRHKQEKMRLNLIEYQGIKIINDAYNASPSSMKAALSVLSELGRESRKIAVLADMLELGDWAKDVHLEVGKYVYEKGIDVLFTLGDNGKYIAEGAKKSGMGASNIFIFNSKNEMAESLKNFLKEGDVVLIKGSRGMRMEEVVEGGILWT